MALTYSKMVDIGGTAPDFSLPGVDGKSYSLASFQDAKALVVIFMCNHCPYVIAVQERINQLAKDYLSKGVRVVGINPNDSSRYPDDSFEKMKERAKNLGFTFPYLLDESQKTAQAYQALCTPDFFVYENTDSQFLLRYRGRLDDNWKEPEKVTQRELAAALDLLLAGRSVSSDQMPSMGCSIKWKPGNEPRFE